MSVHAVAASSDAPGAQSGEGGSQPTLLLQLFDLGVPTFGDWLETRRVSLTTAKAWFGQYHYSGTHGTDSAEFIGIFAPDLMAVVGIGYPANESGVATKYGLEAWRGNREITRVAVHPIAPRNSASRAVSRVLRGITDLDWLYSYADTGQGHHGGIYQALRAVYVGMSPGRYGYLLDGAPIHPRSVATRWGSESMDTILELQRNGIAIERVPDMNTPKHIYILPLGKEGPAIRAHLSAVALPYPKRATS